ncbi:Coenzyme Q-binding protein coq10, mitochondrial [Gnomoniopsis smithogilvyi]|uniref:Coenzyme Q-binding protein coq10, mitochondrial n=1 Tax=Gnomoniopsis smithogilvyi TaxID=1191159 RepID=A0A9W8YSN9_9PEZI|nr:Coenzyme Q-binding protein coq10, mitochondrial [Gnomoniopsis smithogilvyi]
MAAKGPLRPLVSLFRHHPTQAPRRTFFDGLLRSEKPLAINVTRTIPYPRAKLYDLIVDVDSYSKFLPFCHRSRVTSWTAPDANNQRWPTEGELTVGYGPITQSYTSRIVCVPGRSVEALSGTDEPVAKKDGGKNPFKQLVTRWTVEDAPAPKTAVGEEQEWTKVDLDMTMRLEDPFLQIMLSKVTDETATKMIEAFEKRVRDELRQGR